MVKIRKLQTRASKSKESTKFTHNHSNFIMEQYLQSYYGGLHTNQTSTDVILILNDGFTFAHGAILQAVSPFFDKMLNSQGPFIQGMRKILMPDFTMSIIKKVLQLIYNSQVQLNSEEELHEVQNVLKFLEIHSNETLCVIQPSSSTNNSSSIKNGTINSDLQNPVAGSSSGSFDVNCTTNSNEQLNNKESARSSTNTTAKKVGGRRKTSTTLINKSMNSLAPQTRTRKGKQQQQQLASSSSTLTTNSNDNVKSVSIPPKNNNTNNGESSSKSDNDDDSNNNNNNVDASSSSSKGKRKLKNIPSKNIINNKKQKTVTLTDKNTNNDNNTSKPSNSNGETLNSVRDAEEPALGEIDNSDDEDAIEFKNSDWLLNKASKCQKCKKVYDSPALASNCLSRHKLLRCYFCFRLFQNTEQLFRHFSRSHKNTRENYLQCPFCEQSVPFKSVSCHCISLHMMNNKEPVNKKTLPCHVPSSSSQPSDPVPGPSRVTTGVNHDTFDVEQSTNDLTNPNPNYVDSDSD